MVHVEVDDRHAGQALPVDRVLGRDAHVVEEAETLGLGLGLGFGLGLGLGFGLGFGLGLALGFTWLGASCVRPSRPT